MSKLILLIGIPGSGKTTLAKILTERGFLRLSADAIRQELWGDEGEQKEPDKVFAIFFEHLDKALGENKDIVVDNTNINSRHRQPIIEKAKQAGYQDIQLWILDTPLEICLARNEARVRKVPEEIVRNMDKTLAGHGKPKRHEGRIVRVRPGKQAGEFLFEQS